MAQQSFSCTRTIGASCRHFNSITYQFVPTLWKFPNDFALFVGSGREDFLVQDECVDDDTVPQNIDFPGRTIITIAPIIIDRSRLRNTVTVFHYSLAAGQLSLSLSHIDVGTNPTVVDSNCGWGGGGAAAACGGGVMVCGGCWLWGLSCPSTGRLRVRSSVRRHGPIHTPKWKDEGRNLD
jgi:hypothetical protein